MIKLLYAACPSIKEPSYPKPINEIPPEGFLGTGPTWYDALADAIDQADQSIAGDRYKHNPEFNMNASKKFSARQGFPENIHPAPGHFVTVVINVE